MPKISVIVPALNEELLLPVLLESLKNQTFTDFEIVVADAGSKDRTVEIAKEFGAKVVPGGMPGPGRNRGAEVAEGDFFFFFDSDVTLPNDFLEKAYKEMQERFLDLATCEFLPLSDLQLDKVMFKVANLHVKLNLNLNPRAPGFCIFITKRLFQRIGGFDESLKLAEDHDLVDRASKYRPLAFLYSSNISVSVRRLEKEGRFGLIEKYLQVELHLFTKGNVKKSIIEYEFGNFNPSNDKTKTKKILDDIEARVIQLEDTYARRAETFKAGLNDLKEMQEKIKRSFEEIGSAFEKILRI